MASAQDRVKQVFGVGDTDTTRRYPLIQNKGAMDLTSMTGVQLCGRRRGSDTAFTPINGVIASPSTAGLVDFDHDTIAATAGVYDCDIVTVSASGIRSCVDTFKIVVRARAASLVYD